MKQTLDNTRVLKAIAGEGRSSEKDERFRGVTLMNLLQEINGWEKSGRLDGRESLRGCRDLM